MIRTITKNTDKVLKWLVFRKYEKLAKKGKTACNIRFYEEADPFSTCYVLREATKINFNSVADVYNVLTSIQGYLRDDYLVNMNLLYYKNGKFNHMNLYDFWNIGWKEFPNEITKAA